MRSINIPYIPEISRLSSVQQATSILQSVPVHELTEQPWPSFPYKPEVKFSIAHTGEHILIHYKVDEAEVRYVNTAINSPVWEDSCVEFFISFDDAGYYNFEFNCIGTALVGFGKERNNRQLLPVTLIERIQCFSSMEQQDGNIHWELLVVIPVSVFMHHPGLNLKGKKCRANFYKCGDLLLQPHFLAWNLIETAEPDFHQPGYFGEIEYA